LPGFYNRRYSRSDKQALNKISALHLRDVACIISQLARPVFRAAALPKSA